MPRLVRSLAGTSVPRATRAAALLAIGAEAAPGCARWSTTPTSSGPRERGRARRLHRRRRATRTGSARCRSPHPAAGGPRPRGRAAAARALGRIGTRPTRSSARCGTRCTIRAVVRAAAATRSGGSATATRLRRAPRAAARRRLRDGAGRRARRSPRSTRCARCDGGGDPAVRRHLQRRPTLAELRAGVSATQAIELFGIVVIGYFAILNGLYLVFTGVAWRDDHAAPARLGTPASTRSSPRRSRRRCRSSCRPTTRRPGSSRASARCCGCATRASRSIVVNDGSTDGTLARLQEAFGLVDGAARRCAGRSRPRRSAAPTRRRATRAAGARQGERRQGGRAERRRQRRALPVPPEHRRRRDGRGGRAPARRQADARRPRARGRDRRHRPHRQRLHHRRRPRTEVRRLPRSRLATLQVVEYFRAFLVGRVGWSRLGSLLIISGRVRALPPLARRGGRRLLDHTTVGEDMELVVRMHRHLRERGEAYRIAFVPDPVCWTEAPETRRRSRASGAAGSAAWPRRSGATAAWRSTRATACSDCSRCRTSSSSSCSGPLIELLGYIVLPVAVALGLLSVPFLVAFLIVAVLLGALLSVSALALEEFSFRRHPRPRRAADGPLRVRRVARLPPAHRPLARLAFVDLARQAAPGAT